MTDENLTQSSTDMTTMPGEESPILAKRPMLVGLKKDMSDELREDDDPMPLLGSKRGNDFLDLEDGVTHADDSEEEEEGQDNRRKSGPWRQASKSTLDESDKLLVDGDEESNSDEEAHNRSSMASSRTAITPRTIEY